MAFKKNTKPSRASVLLLVLRIGIRFPCIFVRGCEVMTPWLLDRLDYLQLVLVAVYDWLSGLFD